MNGMAKRALMLWTLAAACEGASANVVGSASFETGLDGWAMDSAAAGSLPFNPGVARVRDPAHTGRWAVMLDGWGGNQSGAVWLERGIAVDAGTYDVTVTFWVWSPTQTDVAGSSVLGAIGTSNPESRNDLAVVDRTGIVAGWRASTLRKTVTIQANQPLWVALGFGLTSAANQKFGFDDVIVDIVPHPPQTCRADFDQSGQVTMGDLLTFLDKWLSGSPVADFDGSGGLDTLDVFDFLNAWFAGCGGTT